MTEFKKGDKVKATYGSIQTVHAVSDDGEYLWLMDDGGDLSTYGADPWTVIPKFFEAGKEYRSKSGSLVYVHHVTLGLNGSPLALAENVTTGMTLTLRPEHAPFYDF